MLKFSMLNKILFYFYSSKNMEKRKYRSFHENIKQNN